MRYYISYWSLPGWNFCLVVKKYVSMAHCVNKVKIVATIKNGVVLFLEFIKNCILDYVPLALSAPFIVSG